MKFLLSLKQSWPRSQILATFILNIYQIQIILSLLIQSQVIFYGQTTRFIFYQSQSKSTLVTYAILIFNIILLILILFQGSLSEKSTFYSKSIHSSTVAFIKIFPYIAYIPLLSYSLSGFNQQDMAIKVVSIINCLIFTFFYQLNQLSNWAFRFIQADFCNQRYSNQITFGITIIYLILLKLMSPFYASFLFLVRALVYLIQIFNHYEYPLIQKVHLFYSLYSIFIFGLVISSSYMDYNILKQMRQLSFLLICALVICYTTINPILLRLNYDRIRNSNQMNLLDDGEKQNLSENVNKMIQQYQNVLRILARVYLQRQKMLQSEPNSYNNWWQVFNQVILMHRVQCTKNKCMCTMIRDNTRFQSAVYVIQLLKMCDNLCRLNTKMKNLKIMSIYLFIQIAKKPLKAYYEIMRLKQQKIKSDILIQLQYLTKQTRECFDQVFLKSKAKNQQLQLLKVIQYEQQMTLINRNLQQIIQEVISFHEMFLYTTVQTSAIKKQSSKIFQKKKLIQSQIQNMITNFCDNTRLNLIIFVFYKYLQVYKSKQSQFKKLSSQQMLKKRIYSKTQVNIFSPQYGSIFIDLVEQRGKILNLTNNICDAFFYSRDQMVNFNIKRFMPTIYARYHDRFLSNFIQKGKIKLLKQRQRIIYSKNKKKFIFPINVRLKAEYLLDNAFGSSSLINGVTTNSSFIMVGQNGKLQQISQNIYKKLFAGVFRDQVIKCNRLSVFKLLPSLNYMFDKTQQTFNPNKIYEGIIICSQWEDILIQKFRYARDLSLTGTSMSGMSISNKSSMSQSKMSIMSSSHTQNGSAQQSQLIDFLTQTFKSFLVDLNIFRLKGYKISYKLSTIHTAQFDLTLIQILTIQNIQGITFYRQLLQELTYVAQIYQLNQQHGPIMQHLKKTQQIIKQNRCNEYIMYTGLDRTKMVERPKNQGHNQIQRKRQSLANKQNTKQIIKQQNNNAQQLLYDQNSDKGFMQIQQGNQFQFNNQCSQRSSVLGSTQSQSKKQILINAFNSKQNMVSKNILLLMNIGIVALISLLIIVSYFSIQYILINKDLWQDIHLFTQAKQTFQFQVSLIETQMFKNNMHDSTAQQLPNFITRKRLQTSDSFRKMMQQINKITFDKDIDNNFYTKLISISNPIDNSKNNLALPTIFNTFLNMIRYNSVRNINWLRQNYSSMHESLRKLQLEKRSIVQQYQTENYFRVIISISVYLFLVVLISVLILPTYHYYKDKQTNVIGLLSYMSSKQIKKSVQKFKILKQLLKSKQNNVTLFYQNFQQKTNDKKTQKQKVDQMQVNNSSTKTLKVTCEQQDKTSFKKTKIIIFLVLFLIFLSNLALISLYITQDVQKFFTSNIKATKYSYQLQNKSPILINIVLSNINRFIQKSQLMQYPASLYEEVSEGFFKPLGELSKQQYRNNKISQFIKEKYQSQICNLIKCTQNNSEGITEKQLSFSYLVLKFRAKFNILLPQNKITINQDLVQQWIKQNSIESFILWLEELISMSQTVNEKIYVYFNQQQEKWIMGILIFSLTLIPINIFLIIFAQFKFLQFLNKILTQSEQIFRHFNVTVLTENTYLTSYFNSKIKQNK